MLYNHNHGPSCLNYPCSSLLIVPSDATTSFPVCLSAVSRNTCFLFSAGIAQPRERPLVADPPVFTSIMISLLPARGAPHSSTWQQCGKWGF